LCSGASPAPKPLARQVTRPQLQVLRRGPPAAAAHRFGALGVCRSIVGATPLSGQSLGWGPPSPRRPSSIRREAAAQAGRPLDRPRIAEMNPRPWARSGAREISQLAAAISRTLDPFTQIVRIGTN